MMAGVLLAVSFGCVESPRYSVLRGRTTVALQSLSRLWGLPADDPTIMYELELLQNEHAIKSSEESGFSIIHQLKSLFGCRINIHRMLFLVCAQILSQWSGTNAITSRSKNPTVRIECY